MFTKEHSKEKNEYYVFPLLTFCYITHNHISKKNITTTLPSKTALLLKLSKRNGMTEWDKSHLIPVDIDDCLMCVG